MERMTRAQMVAEFGVTGVQNPMILDLIEVDPVSGKVVLVMIERRAWGSDARQFTQIEEKINRYLGYVLDGFLAQQHPQHQGKQVRIRLDCAQTPQGEAARFMRAAGHSIGSQGMEFVVNVVATADRAP